jgi:hypothetical protein
MRYRRRAESFLILSGALLSPLMNAAQSQQPQPDPKLTEVWEPVPRVVTPGVGTAAPSDAIVLFNGRDLSEWQRDDGSATKWKIGEHAMTVVKSGGNIQTKRAFGDCQLHIEWRTPSKVEGEGQERGNSGVFLQGRYEVQVLDSYNNRTYSNGQAASIYKQYIPMVNASRKPGEWQSYDIFFRAPRFADNGTVTTPGYMTVVHNGVLVQDHVEIKGTTFNSGPQSYQKHNLKEPLMLQDHGTPVSYRNIWIREL